VTRLPPQTFAAIAIVATLNGVIVQMIMVSRILYGLSDRGHLPSQLSRVHPVTRTPLLATALVVVLVLVLAMGFRLEVLAEWTSRVTLVVFALVNTALLKIKMDRGVAPAHAFVVPAWIPALGALSCIAFLLADVLR
jgi:amino acid transporter